MRFLHFLTWLVHSHKRWFFFLWSAIVVWFLWSDVGFANPETSVVTHSETKQTNNINVLNHILGFVSVILWLASMLVGAMIHPNWTYGDIVWLGWGNGVLKQMWILVSNVVYFVFALIFVGIAFLTIYKWESYALKEKLPRFIAWILIVPFSWFIVQFVVSISSLLTYAVLVLPFDTMNTINPQMLDDLWKTTVMCKEITIDTTPDNATPISPALNTCENGKKITLNDILNVEENEWIFGIMSIYTYGILEIQKINKITLTDAGSIVKTILSLSAASFFDVLFVVVYMLIMIALILALFVRWIYMWLYAMFSPAFWLLWFFWKEKEWMMEGKFGILQFINLALIPVYVWAALSFGLLFIFVAWDKNAWFSNSDVISIHSAEGPGKDATKVEFMKKTSGHVTVTLQGPQGTYLWAASDKWTITEKLSWYRWVGWKLLLRLFWLAILYMTVMLALKSSKVTESVASPFFEFWKSIGGMIAKAPLNTPIIPTGMWKTSISWLQAIWSRLENSARQIWVQSGEKIWDALVKQLFPSLDAWTKKMNDTLSRFDTNNQKFDSDSRWWLTDLLKNMTEEQWNKWRTDNKFRTMMQAAGVPEAALNWTLGQYRISMSSVTDNTLEKSQQTHSVDKQHSEALTQALKNPWWATAASSPTPSEIAAATTAATTAATAAAAATTPSEISSEIAAATAAATTVMNKIQNATKKWDLQAAIKAVTDAQTAPSFSAQTLKTALDKLKTAIDDAVQ